MARLRASNFRTWRITSSAILGALNTTDVGIGLDPADNSVLAR
jgi:hypothetical protein